MNRPATRAFVLGHPIAVFAGVGLLVLSGLTFVHNQESWPFALFCWFVMHKVMQAHEAVIAYQRWKAEWDAMGGVSESRNARPGRLIAASAIVLTGWLAYSQPLLLASCAGYAAGWASLHPWVLAIPAVWVAALVARKARKRPRRAKASKPVAVVAKRTLSVPKVEDAYRALPPYCLALLRGQQ